MTKEDLIDVKAKPSTLPPRPSTQNSIPALLTALQSEYDAIMLESLEIKKAFQNSRAELANALYREDAATRVIARLIKERDEAREALSSIQASVGLAPSASASAPAQEDVEMESGALPKEVEDVLMETNASLSSVRKKRKPAPGYANAETVKTYVQVKQIGSMHGTKPPGVSALDLSKDGKTIVTGGMDKVVQVFDIEGEKSIATLKGHTKPVTHVQFREHEGLDRMAISTAADKTVRFWGEDGGSWSAKGHISAHKGDVTGLAIHPSGLFASTGSTDSNWSMHDIASTKTIATYKPVAGEEGSFSYTSLDIHPDGILHGLGTKDGHIRVWDARQNNVLAGSLLVPGGKEITTLSFSENGYYLATGSSADSLVSVFDLRKLKVLSSWNLPSENSVHEVRFDPSAQFLSVAGTDLRVYANKSWDELLKFDDNNGILTAARFGNLGSEIVLSGLDRTVRVLGQQQ